MCGVQSFCNLCDIDWSIPEMKGKFSEFIEFSESDKFDGT